MYYRARYYDPAVGRFISEDMIGFRGGIDFYVYTHNRSTLLIDAFGYQANTAVPRMPIQCTAEQWAQSPNACAGPQDPNAPYEGVDGYWYNVNLPKWPPVHSRNPEPAAPTPTLPQAISASIVKIPVRPDYGCSCHPKSQVQADLEGLAAGSQVVDAFGETLLGGGLIVTGIAGGAYVCLQTGGLGCGLALEAAPAFVVGGYYVGRSGVQELKELFGSGGSSKCK